MKTFITIFKETGKKRDRLALLRGLAITTVLVTGLAGCGGGGGLAGKWESLNVGEDSFELFKDGTGSIDGATITWKTENSRLIVSTFVETTTYGYKVEGPKLTLTDEDGEVTTYVKNTQKLTGPLTEEEADSLNKQAGFGEETAWYFAKGDKYEDLSVKKGLIKAVKATDPNGDVFVLLEADNKTIKAAKYGDIYEQYEATGGNEKAAKLILNRNGRKLVYEQWECDAEGNETYLEDGKRVSR